MLNMDPYVYPGTDVLKNLRDIRDQDSLNKAEAIATTRRLTELYLKPKASKFDIPHLQSIHHHIFQDIYPWAGKFSQVNIARSGQFFFAFHEQIPSVLNQTFQGLNTDQHLANGDPAKFANRAAYYLGELNAIHPFRDGNRRTQREFVRQLALHHKYHLNWFQVSRDQMYKASEQSFHRGDNQGLEDAIVRALANDPIS